MSEFLQNLAAKVKTLHDSILMDDKTKLVKKQPVQFASVQVRELLPRLVFVSVADDPANMKKCVLDTNDSPCLGRFILSEGQGLAGAFREQDKLRSLPSADQVAPGVLELDEDVPGGLVDHHCADEATECHS